MPASSSATVTISLRRNGSTKRVIVYPGIPTEELRKTLEAAFLSGERGTVKGIVDSRKNKTFPLSFLSRSPTYFSRGIYDLVVEVARAPQQQQQQQQQQQPQHAISRKQSVSHLFSLSNVDVRRIMAIFDRAAPTGVLDRPTFQRCFQGFLTEEGRLKQSQDESSRMGAVLNRMFDIFDRDGNGVVDSKEFLSGLSVLCQGNRDEKIRAAFELYDINGDGFITEQEMARYLTAVFSVISETSPDVFQQHNVTPQELGQITAEQCFQEADLNHDGRLSFDEFRKWYSDANPMDDGASPVADAPSSNLEAIRRITGLNQYSPQQVFEVFRREGHDGELDRRAFRACFRRLAEMTGQTLDDKAQQFLDRVFDLFDQDGNGIVDFEELGSGISVLCGGTRDEKIRAAFQLYDYNKDGYISLSEMTAYLTSVFRVLYESSPETEQIMGVSADELGAITAEQCFDEADVDQDGRLSFQEFKRWYSKPSNMAVRQPVAAQQQQQRQPREELPQWISLTEARRLTCLDRYSPSDVLETFALHANEQGQLTTEGFATAFKSIIASCGPQTREDKQKMLLVLDRLFRAFDVDNDGCVDFGELVSGLTILCGGTSHDKIQNAFELYDVDGDGYIDLQEMQRYLGSVFRVLYETMPGVREQMSMEPDVLAATTTMECFQVADLNRDGKLSLEEFTRWYLSDDGIALAGIESTLPAWISLSEVRRVSGLGSVPVEDVFEELAMEANEDGLLDRNSFYRVFQKLSKPSNPNDQERLRFVLDRLFSLFDTDHNGFVDFSEVASGFSILCGGDQDAKAESAFALYDYNGDGFVSVDEMTRYLTCVYKVMYESQPGTEQRIGVSAPELAMITSEQIFQDADLNHDGRLSFDEFRKWYSAGNTQKFSNMVASAPDWVSLDQIRKLTGLNKFAPEHVFEIFALEAQDDGQLDYASFSRAFTEVANRSGVRRNAEENDRLHMVIHRLFTVFDVDDSGRVDFNEISSGLSVLCGGTEDKKAEAAFALYDYNGDGYISIDEMIRYLTCVFKVMYDVEPGTSEAVGVSPEELAVITAQELFANNDRNSDGRLSFAEFQRWYSDTSSGHAINAAADLVASSDLDLSEISRLTGLGEHSTEDVFALFAEGASSDSTLDKPSFDRVCANIAHQQRLSAKDATRLQFVLDRLFDIFDTDGNGLVDFSELASGLSVLCGGTRDDKVQSAFSLFDINGDGYISEEEMIAYLTSVFKVLYETQAGVRDQMGVSAEELAEVTAEQCFQDADLNQDGRLSFEEFQKWYAQPNGQMLSDIFDSTPPWVSIQEVRRLTHLGDLSVEECFEEFAMAADQDGNLTEGAFFNVFNRIIASKTTGSRALVTKSDSERLRTVLKRLFAIFDSDSNGVVDFSELASGLSILCAGDRHEKAEAAFALYDYNGDGFISVSEMERYLSAVFRVMYETQPGTKESAGVSAEALAKSTAREIFVEADLNADGRLSFDEFKGWYSSDSNVAVNRVIEEVPRAIPLSELRRLTGLGKYPAAFAFEEFAMVTDDEGVLDRPSFFQVFNKFVTDKQVLSSREDKEKLRLVLNNLFDLFDTDNNGVVDFSELASGMSVICAGDMDSKAEACFALYDYNSDGFISLDEMTRYLASVFKIVYLMYPDRAAQVGVSPSELAGVTAEVVFQDADVDQDGRLSFDEFKKWYSSSSELVLPGASAPRPPARRAPSAPTTTLSLDELRSLTGLGAYSPEDCFEEFAVAANNDGLLDHAAFVSVFNKISNRGRTFTPQERETLRNLVVRLFEVFDQDGNGLVDFGELASGLSVLCGGSSDAKAEAAFALYDYNGDGFISETEMTRYLSAVFKVMYETQPTMVGNVRNMSPDNLAAITSKQVFEEADVNHDGRLSFDEFKKWYSQANETSNAVQNLQNEATDWITLPEVRRLTGLDKYTAEQCVEILAMEAKNGMLDRTSFQRAFGRMIDPNTLSKSDLQKVRLVLMRLFESFDTDKNGLLDFTELASGLSVLCGGHQTDKARIAFQLFDYNGDGFITLGEMCRYLTAVFKVLYETIPESGEMVGVDAETLARATAEQCFLECDLNHDGRLSFEEFSRWFYSGGNMLSASQEAPSSGRKTSLAEIRRLTKLESFDVENVLDFIRGAMDPRTGNSLDLATFKLVFSQLLESAGGHDNEQDIRDAAVVIERLFTLFDVDRNGVVDFKELASGLSVLCAGTREDKARSAFELYDYNGDGYISLEEMTKYLGAVFKVLYEAQPETGAQMGVSAEDLGAITAQQCFMEADLNSDGRLSFDEFKAWYAQQ